LLLQITITGCQIPPIIAQMTATINISSETATSQSSVANVNFNEVDYEVIGGESIIQFSNSDGYTIQFQLLGSSPNPTSYSMSSGNSLSGAFLLTNNGQSVSVNVVSTGLGSLEITSILIENDQVTSMSGSFKINVTSGSAEQEADGIIEGIISF
ncbi:MAG: hypothetical protein KDK51_11000, partial [Deltaproteobacteria bacterium]|nr:hypothetical protein [Deltaproteobacteria bacterium]